jgi:structural maintenance of chromosome 2
MLEETAGTSLYNNMKSASEKLILKKEAKVKEMTNVLINEIEPQMKRLREERDNYFL